MKDFEKKIFSTCRLERDHTQEFSNKVLRLKKDAENKFTTFVEHSDDMNYGASNQLTFFIDKSGKFLKRNSKSFKNTFGYGAEYLINLLISSLGNYYYIEIFRRNRILGIRINGWHYEPSESENAGTKSETKIINWIETKGFQQIPKKLLEKEVPFKKRELDNKPATVFDLIFSEI